MTMRVSLLGLLVLGACTYGVEGEFAATEAGLVSIEAFRLDGAQGPVQVVRSTTDGLDLVIEFEVEGQPGELRILGVQTVLSHGGTATMRTWENESWSAPETLRLAVVADSFSTRSSWPRRELVIDLGWGGEPKALQTEETPVGEEWSPEPAEETPSDSSSGADSLGSLVVVLVEPHC